MQIEELEKIVKKNLSEYRYYHSKCVQKRCRELAIIYNIDVEMAEKVGIMHDIAKEMYEEEKLQYVEKNHIAINEIERKNPELLHAKIGAHMAKELYGFTEEMARAIESHTTGKEHMDLLAKILFVADATGEDRTWEDVPRLRKRSENNLDEVIICIIEKNIVDNLKKGRLIHLDSIYARNELVCKNMVVNA